VTASKKPNEYLKVKIQTAKPAELLILLFDGAIRFTGQAKRHLEAHDYEEKNDLLLRAQNIVLELLQALDQRIGPELYARLTELYRFCYERLIQANIKNDAAAAEAAITVLEHLRETWQLAIKKSRDEQSETSPQAETGRALCLEG
jgi:flagellar protein FliS